MNASYEWLKAFVPLDLNARQLRDLITSHTATVDELVPMRADLAPIVIGKVLTAAPHPDSDHLWFTTVDAGGPEPLEVVCGASNVTAGKLYPFASVGTTMPNGIKIERRKIRGLVSNGMLCSAKELGLGDNHEGILELTIDATPGTPFLTAMPVGDSRLVIDAGANRPDLLSHLGLARELATVTGKAWQLPTLPGVPAAGVRTVAAMGHGTTAGIAVRVNPDTRTRRYLALVIRGVKVGPSPSWLVDRLATVGSRSINNVVDATNYVLHEYGQPIHAFDLDKLKGSVTVRLAAAKEEIVTLDGQKRLLPAGAVVIADDTRAHAVAGVMGAHESEVTGGTTNLLIEVASFDPQATRTTRRAMGLATDASYRFERGVDAGIAAVGALERVASIIVGVAGGIIAGDAVDIVGEQAPPTDLTLRARRLTQVLGADVPLIDARRMLESAGFGIREANTSELKVRVPSWRADVAGEIDLIEEVARFHGYDRFPSEIRAFRPSTTVDDPRWALADRVRRAMAGLGYFETRPMPFVRGDDATHVRVQNPLSEDEAHLRNQIGESLALRAEHNLAHRSGDLRVFEVGSVFAPGASAQPVERMHVGVLLMGRRRPPHFSDPQPPMLDAWDAKAVAEAVAAVAFPGTAIELVPGNDPLWEVRVGGLSRGRVFPVALDAPVWAAPAFGIELTLAEIDGTPAAARGQHHYMDAGAALAGAVRKFVALPNLPSAEVDLAVLVPKPTTVAQVERVIRESAGDLLESLVLFDQYTGAGVPQDQRSLAWRLTFRHPERTLRDKEIEGRRAKIVRALDEELHVRQRTT